MLKIDFDIKISSECNSLIFRNLQSKSDGFGVAGNIAIEQVTKTILRIRTPNGVKYNIISTYLPTQGEWELFAKDVSDLQKESGSPSVASPDCGCNPNYNGIIPSNLFYWDGYGRKSVYSNQDCSTPNKLIVFPDGCTDITYEVYSKTGIPVLACEYLANTVLCEDQRFFAKRSGGWYDVTNSGTLNNKNFSIRIASTIDVYDEWKVMGPDGVVSSGEFTKLNCSSSGLTSTSPTDTMVASVTKTFSFSCNIERMMARAAFALTVKDDCGILNSGVAKMQAISILSLARAKILAIKDMGTDCGCSCVESTINSAFNNLKAAISLDK